MTGSEDAMPKSSRFFEMALTAGDDSGSVGLAAAAFGVLVKKLSRVRWFPPPGVLADDLEDVFAGVLVSFGGIVGDVCVVLDG